MPIVLNSRPYFWIIAIVALFFLVNHLSSVNTMDSLDFSFKIEIEGQAIAEVGGGEQNPTQATTGTNTAAIFTLRDGRLSCGEWILARKWIENRSMAPKEVLWFKVGTGSEEQAQPVTAQREGENYQIKFQHASLIAREGKVFADLQGTGEPNSVVKVSREDVQK